MDSISVIIPTYNGATLLRECLCSLELQAKQPSEVIIVDNGSSDNTEQVAKDSRLNVLFVKLPYNEGFSKAVNQGILKSQGELILLLNNDVKLGSDCIKNLLNATQNKKYGSFAPLIFNQEGTAVQSAGLMFSNRGYGNRSNNYLYNSESSHGDIFAPCGAVALYRRSALEDIGLFNEKFFLFFEDLELGFRLQLRGYRCLLVTSAKAYHIGGATAQNFFLIKVEQSLINSITILITCVPTKWLLKNAFHILHFYYKLIINCWKRGYQKEVLRAFKSIIRNLPGALSYRIKVQSFVNYDIKYLSQLLYTGAIRINFKKEIVRIP